MEVNVSCEQTAAAAEIFTGGSEMAALMRACDWSSSPLGPASLWPHSLRTLVGLMLESRQPMFIAWGSQRIMLYNDGYAPICGHRHPAALGQRFEQVWFDIMNDVGPILDRAYAGESTHMDDIRFVMHRHGYPEETHFSFSYTPVRDESGAVAGMFCACNEITEKVLTERRLKFQFDLGERLRPFSDPNEVIAAASEMLGRYVGVARVGYAEVEHDNEHIQVERDWTDGTVMSVAGRHRMEDFGPPIIAEMRAGRTMCVDDVTCDPRTAGTAVEAFANIGARTVLAVPLFKNGRFAALLYLHDPKPRHWTKFDAELAEDVVERTWSAVERARAEAQLHEVRRQAEIRAAENAAVLRQLAEGVIVTDRTGRITFVNEAAARLHGVAKLDVTPDAYSETYHLYTEDGHAYPPEHLPLARAVLRSESVADARWRIRRPDGTEVLAIGSAAPLRGSDGSINGAVLTVRDDTARTAAEAALRESETRLRSAVLASPFPTMLHAEDGEVLELSRKWTEFTGYEREQIKTHFDWLKLAYPHDHAVYERAIAQEFTAEGEIAAGEHKVRVKDGSTRIWDFYNAGLGRLPDGRRLQISAATDVTERKRAEDALRLSEEQFRTLAENMSQLAWMADAKGSVYWYNKRWYDYTGTTLEDMQDRGWKAVQHPGHADRVLRRLQYSWDTGALWEDTFPLRGKDGEYRWFLSRALPIRDGEGNILRWFGTNTDITVQRQTEDALKRSEERLRLALEGSQMGDWSWDAETDVLTFSARAGEIFGVTRTNAIWAEILGLIHSDDVQSVKDHIRNAIIGHGAYEAEYRVKRRDDQRIVWASARGRALYGEDGRATGMTGVVMDITHRKESEEAERLLIREVDHRAKNVLAVVQALAQLTPFHTHKQYTASLTGRIRALARVHSLLSKNRWVGVNLNAIICGELDPYKKEHGDFIQIEGPPVDLKPEAAQPLSFVMHELATNAAKHGALSTPQGRVSVAWRWCDDNKLALTWAEEGGPPVHEPKKRGFGTTLIDNAVKQLGGAIERQWVEAGFACIIRLDRNMSVARSPSPAKHQTNGKGLAATFKNARVLIVEDEALVAMDMERMLGEAGASVIGPAQTLDDALLLALQQNIDCAVLDVNLGGQQVTPLAQILLNRKVPFIFVTGYQDPGVDGARILRKPVTQEVLLEALSEALSKPAAANSHPSRAAIERNH